MLTEVFTRAKKRSVPLVLVVTPDPAATVRELCTTLNGDAQAVCWDLVRGLHEPPITYGLADKLRGGAEDETLFAPVAFAQVIRKMPAHGVAFGLQFDRYLHGQDAAGVTQAVWNLRDQFKQDERMLVMLCSDGKLPVELKNDVLVLDEPLPNEAQLKAVVTSLCKAAKKASTTFAATPDDIARAAVRVTGLSQFAAEQAVAMSLRAGGIDQDDLWARKRKLIEATPGLAVYGGEEHFGDLRGVDNVTGYLRRVIDGKRSPNVIVMVDEIEKALAGAHGDTSGVSQGQLQCLLTEMQDQSYPGCIFIGPPGSGKSMVSKAAGNEAGVPTILFDLNGMKDSLVGASERNMRDALKVVRAVGDGKALWLATCNEITQLPSALRRRYTLGTFFFDLPTGAERKAIWELYLGRYDLAKDQRAKRPDDEGWTGAEIKQCCDNAWALGVTLKESAGYVVPIVKSAATEIRRLRQEASGRFLSASQPGVYQFRENEQDGQRGITM